jgi:hypothetical protein
MNLACFERESKGAADGCTALPQAARTAHCAEPLLPGLPVIQRGRLRSGCRAANRRMTSSQDALDGAASLAASEFVSHDFPLLGPSTTCEPRELEARSTLATRCAFCPGHPFAAGAGTLFGVDHSRRLPRFLPSKQAGNNVLRIGFAAPRTVEKTSQNGSRHPLQSIFYRPGPSPVRRFRFCSKSVWCVAACMKPA